MRSFAGTMFQRYPQAEHVVVQIQYYGLETDSPTQLGDIPTMAEYRDGERPTWITFHQIPPLSRQQYYPLKNEDSSDEN